MAIPETQLDTWAHQGSITQSSNTYSAVKSALEQAGAAYSSRSFNIYLQGSYANDTNIFADSDVDVVIQLDDCFYWDDTALPAPSQAALAATRGPGVDYDFNAFRRDVLAQLLASFSGIVPGEKAVFIPGSGARRNADVLIAVTHRRYFLRSDTSTVDHRDGVCFFTPAGVRIANYPKLHSIHCTAKHQATNQWFKPAVRILKNMRNNAVNNGLLGEGVAPSYFLEGMLHNVPNDQFGGNYEDTIVNSLNWLLKADAAQLICANAQQWLVREGTPTSWPKAHFDAFLNAMSQLWRDW